MMDVLGAHRVHVMDLDHLDDLESLDAEVTAEISCNYLGSGPLPFTRAVELLVQPSLVPEVSIATDPFNLKYAKRSS